MRNFGESKFFFYCSRKSVSISKNTTLILLFYREFLSCKYNIFLYDVENKIHSWKLFSLLL